MYICWQCWKQIVFKVQSGWYTNNATTLEISDCRSILVLSQYLFSHMKFIAGRPLAQPCKWFKTLFYLPNVYLGIKGAENKQPFVSRDVSLSPLVPVKHIIWTVSNTAVLPNPSVHPACSCYTFFPSFCPQPYARGGERAYISGVIYAKRLGSNTQETVKLADSSDTIVVVNEKVCIIRVWKSCFWGLHLLKSPASNANMFF